MLKICNQLYSIMWMVDGGCGEEKETRISIQDCLCISFQLVCCCMYKSGKNYIKIVFIRSGLSIGWYYLKRWWFLEVRTTCLLLMVLGGKMVELVVQHEFDISYAYAYWKWSFIYEYLTTLHMFMVGCLSSL